MKMTASAACAAVLTFASITGIGVAVAQTADQPYQQDRGQQGGYRQPGQGYGQQQTQTEQPGYTRRADGQQNQGQRPYGQQDRHDQGSADQRGGQQAYGQQNRDQRGDSQRDGRQAGGWAQQSEWRRGGHLARGDWEQARQVDWRRHHLRRPPRGYEWRQVNGNYVLAAAATGLIASLIGSQR